MAGVKGEGVRGSGGSVEREGTISLSERRTEGERKKEKYPMKEGRKEGRKEAKIKSQKTDIPTSTHREDPKEREDKGR